MFTCTIAVDGFVELSVHWVHQHSAAKCAILLLFIHGWPGSFVEVTKVLPLLTTVSADRPSFHVVMPSLPGSSCQQAHDLAGLLRIRDPRWRLGPYCVLLKHAHVRLPNGMPAHVHRLSVKICDLPSVKTRR
ncbi:hypothetical protein EDB89DRAFT_1981238 [Lactarius sanguifluus]|nr:hypothetical protein EDB89DRAFT_1981238 [Lactarius sanguifluus]